MGEAIREFKQAINTNDAQKPQLTSDQKPTATPADKA
jgi:Sec-independent protein translocase protein TatA